MADEDKKYAFITESEGFAYYVSDNGDVIGYAVGRDGSCSLPQVNC